MVGELPMMQLEGVASTTRIKNKAIEALRESNLAAVFELAGMDGNVESAGAAMKTVLAEKLAEYTIRAMEEAKKRNMRLGAAAIIIAAKGDKA